jgi:hypothetical protein
MVILAALTTRAGHPLQLPRRVPNGALVPLDPEAAAQADLGGGAATVAS